MSLLNYRRFVMAGQLGSAASDTLFLLNTADVGEEVGTAVETARSAFLTTMAGPPGFDTVFKNQSGYGLTYDLSGIDYLQDLTAKELTVEWWGLQVSGATNCLTMDVLEADASRSLYMNYRYSNRLQMGVYSNTATLLSLPQPATVMGVWKHFAVEQEYSGGQYRFHFYYDGSPASYGMYNASVGGLATMRMISNTTAMAAFRISKIRRYNGLLFTPPTAPLLID